MHRSSSIVLLLASLALGGCRAATQANQQLIHREMRLMEDDLYAMQDRIDDADERLASCRRENASLRKELGARQTSRSSTSEPTELDLAPPRIDLPEAPIFQTPASEEAPRFDGSSAEEDPMDETPAEPMLAPPLDDAAQPEIELNNLELNGAAESPRRVADSAQLADVTLNQFLTGGFNADDRVGDEGVMVVVEPRDAVGKLIDVPGEISIAVIDPAQSGIDSRVAQWDFNEHETAAHFKRTLMGAGVHFQLPWPNVPPAGRVLELIVRFRSLDGREFISEKEIEVDPLTARAIHNWTRSAGREDGAVGVAGQAVSNRQNPAPTARPPVERAGEAPRRTAETAARDISRPIGSTDRPVGKRATTTAERPSWRPYR